MFHFATIIIGSLPNTDDDVGDKVFLKSEFT